jgi:hypothetical protein
VGKNQFLTAPVWRLKYAGALLFGMQTRWNSLRGKSAGFSQLQRGDISTLEQIPLREILLLEVIPG